MARRLYDLAVLGEGIVGCFAALRAAELGADVILIDERGVFGGASARAAGVFTVQLDTPRDAMLVAKSIELVKRYSKNSWIETGFLQIGREGALRESLEALTKCEIRYDVLDHREIMGSGLSSSLTQASRVSILSKTSRLSLRFWEGI